MGKTFSKKHLVYVILLALLARCWLERSCC